MLLKSLFGIAILLYPTAVYFGTAYLGTRGCGLLLLGVFLLRALLLRTNLRHSATASTTSYDRLLWLELVGPLVIVLSLAADNAVFLRALPILINVALFVIFFASLSHPPSMIEIFARLMEKNLPPEATHYCRSATRVWCAFFVLNGLLSLFTAVATPFWVWTLYNGFISYVLIALLFLAEYCFRIGFRRRLASEASAEEVKAAQKLTSQAVALFLLGCSLVPSAAYCEPVAQKESSEETSQIESTANLEAIIKRLEQGSQQSSQQGSVQRFSFVQSKRIKALSRPLKAEGELVFAKLSGLIWQLNKPRPSQFIIQKSGLKRREGEQTVKDISAQDNPAVAGFSRVFLSLFSGEILELTKTFSVSTSTTPTGDWQISLTPKEDILRQIITKIELSGDTTISHLELLEQNGDHTSIDFTLISSDKTLRPEEERWLK